MNNNEYVEVDRETVNIVDGQTKNLISIINNNKDLIQILKTQEWYVDEGNDVVADNGKMFLNNVVWSFYHPRK
ncbi:MAG: hypothetical protein ACYC21_00205 [Eubacteriales bacterium]